jgi:hypothetical protein
MSSSVALDPACADAIAQFRRDGGDERAFIVFAYAGAANWLTRQNFSVSNFR